jgi:hypothetical protein
VSNDGADCSFALTLSSPRMADGGALCWRDGVRFAVAILDAVHQAGGKLGRDEGRDSRGGEQDGPPSNNAIPAWTHWHVEVSLDEDADPPSSVAGRHSPNRPLTPAPPRGTIAAVDSPARKFSS